MDDGVGQVDGSGWEGGWTVWLNGWKDGGRKKGTDRRMDLCVVRKIRWDGIGMYGKPWWKERVG